MTVRKREDGVIAMEGRCSLDESETLLMLLSESADPIVDWSACDDAHSAVLQVLLAARPTLIGIPRGRFLRDFIAPCCTLVAEPDRHADETPFVKDRSVP